VGEWDGRPHGTQPGAVSETAPADQEVARRPENRPVMLTTAKESTRQLQGSQLDGALCASREAPEDIEVPVRLWVPNTQ
jgi:hypothetical protein